VPKPFPKFIPIAVCWSPPPKRFPNFSPLLLITWNIWASALSNCSWLLILNLRLITKLSWWSAWSLRMKLSKGKLWSSYTKWPTRITLNLLYTNWWNSSKIIRILFLKKIWWIRLDFYLDFGADWEVCSYPGVVFGYYLGTFWLCEWTYNGWDFEWLITSILWPGGKWWGFHALYFRFTDESLNLWGAQWAFCQA